MACCGTLQDNAKGILYRGIPGLICPDEVALDCVVITKDLDPVPIPRDDVAHAWGGSSDQVVARRCFNNNANEVAEILLPRDIRTDHVSLDQVAAVIHIDPMIVSRNYIPLTRSRATDDLTTRKGADIDPVLIAEKWTGRRAAGVSANTIGLHDVTQSRYCVNVDTGMISGNHVGTYRITDGTY